MVLLVKEPRWEAWQDTGDRRDPSLGRPRLDPALGARQRYRAEFDSLRLIESELGDTDPRFATVRALDFVDSRSAIVMEEVRRPSLRQLMRGYTRLNVRRRPTLLDPVFSHAGAWLRSYHGLQLARAPVRHTRREQVVDFIQSVGSYLEMRTGWRSVVNEAIAVATRAATRSLPPALPAAVHHGDFAMRNILVGERASVAVIDVASIWRTCPLEDVGYFLVDLRTPRIQMLLQQLAFAGSMLDDWHDAFLGGYSSTADGVAGLPKRALVLYQLIAVLDSWTAKTDWMRAKPIASSVTRRLLERSYSRETERLLEQL
jgi:aminoglycoside phosphotransferase (APT) family kinase protein